MEDGEGRLADRFYDLVVDLMRIWAVAVVAVAVVRRVYRC